MSKKIKLLPIHILIIIFMITSLYGCSVKNPYEKGVLLEDNILGEKKSTIGNISKTGWELNIPQKTFDQEETLTMNVLSMDENSNYNTNFFDFIGTAVKISAGTEDSVRLNQPVTINMKLPKDLKLEKENLDDYLIGYYKGDGSWEYIFPDIESLSKGVISFDTYHFSLFGVVKLSEEERIKLYANKLALQNWESEEKEKAVLEKTEAMFKEALEKMGISDRTMQGKLLRSIAKENDFGTLIVSTERGDLADFTVKCGEMAANAIVKHLSLEDALMENFTSKGAAVATGLSKAAIQVYDGNYTDAMKELTSAFIGYFPAGRAYQATIEIIDAGITSWKDYEMNAAYQSYTGMANYGAYGYKINQGDWDTLCIQMRGYLTRVQDDAKNTYCAVNNINRSELDKDIALSQKIADQAVNNLKKQFENRLANEQNIKLKEQENLYIIEGFKKNLLLERGTFGFDFDMEIETRLRTLFSIRNNILSMFNGEMPILKAGESAEDNLNEAITQWLILGPKKRNAFYQWLKDKGYHSKVKFSGGGYAWVLIDVEDFDSKEKWDINNQHLSYEYEHNYGRGSYSAKIIFEGESDSYYNPPKIKGEALGAQAIYSPAPEIIYPDTPVTLNLSLSVTENTQSFFTFSASANASFDEPGIEAGYGTGGAISFVTSDDRYYFEVNKNDNYASINETIAAQINSGTPGQKIALRTSFYMGVPMCTNYIYEWKELQ